jgi:hypothetical protein
VRIRKLEGQREKISHTKQHYSKRNEQINKEFRRGKKKKGMGRS